MSVEGFDHLAITAADVEAAVAFYGEVLGAEPMYLEEFRAGKIPIVMMQVGANRINVHPAAAPACPPACPPARLPTCPPPVRLTCASAGAAPSPPPQAHLAACGVEVIEGPAPRPASNGERGQSVYFRDADDNLLELLTIKG